MVVVVIDGVVVWGLVARILGALFLLAHVSIAPQLMSACGSQGVTPIAMKLAMLRTNFGLRRFIEEPTFLWLSSSDAMIRALNVVGILGSIWSIIGGPYATIGLFAAWISYLSLVDAAGLTFPWDSMLLEAGFLGLFLPSTQLLPELASTTSPSPVAAFAMQWLLVRVMWGFAKVKFIGTKPGDALYLQSFFVWLPVPNPLGLALARAPKWFHKASLAFMFVAEVIAPALVLFPGDARLVGAALLVALMIGIHVTGNWGFFNVAYAALCVAFLDVDTTAVTAAHSAFSIADMVIVVAFAASIVQLLAFNTWVARSWVHWPLFDVLRRKRGVVGFLFGVVVDFFRVLVGLRLVNAYGVFPPNSQSPLRLTPIFELSDDEGKTWKRARYRFLPSDERDRAPVVAPHHPRLDHAVIYAGGGLSDASLVGGLVGFGLPHMSYLRFGALDRFVQHLLSSTSRVPEQVLRAPVPKGTLARVSAWAMLPTTPDERRRTGAHWRMRRVGTMLHATARVDGVAERSLCPPECFHPDLVEWKRRSRPMHAMKHALSSGTLVDDAVLAGSNDLDATMRERFWNDFIPLAREQLVCANERALDFNGADTLRKRFSDDDVFAFERIAARYAWLLRLVVEPLRDERVDGFPRMPAFRFELSLMTAIVDVIARNDLAALMNDAKSAANVVAKLAPQRKRHLATLLLFRPNAVELTAQSWRWSLAGDLLVGRKSLPSVFEYADLLADLVPRDEEWRPVSTRDDDGAWHVEL